MLHRSLLPGHERWARFLRVAALRRRRRVPPLPRGVRRRTFARCCAGCGGSRARYGADPDVRARLGHRRRARRCTAARLIGLPVAAVTDDGSPRGAMTFALWEPPLTVRRGENGAPVPAHASPRPPTCSPTWSLEGVQTLAFVRSRRGAEAVATERAPAARPRSTRRWPSGSRPTAAATCPRSGARSRRRCARAAARAGRDQRPRARHRRQRARRRAAWPAARARGRRCGSRSGGPGAAGRTLGGAGRPRRPARHLPRAPPRGAVRRAGRGDRLRPGQPATCWRRTCARPPRSCR